MSVTNFYSPMCHSEEQMGRNNIGFSQTRFVRSFEQLIREAMRFLF